MAEENLFLVVGIAQRAELVAESELGDHAPRPIGGLADVVAGAGGHVLGPEDQLLGDAPAERHREPGFELDLGIAVLVGFGQRHRHAHGAAARDDGDLVQRIVFRHVQRDQRVPGLVIGGQALFVLGHHHAAPLGAHHDLVLRLLELGHGDEALVLARRQERRLVDQVGEVRAGEAGRAARDDARVDIGRQRHLPHMDLEDLLAP